MTTNEEWIIGHTPVKEEFPTFSMLFQRREGGGGGGEREVRKPKSSQNSTVPLSNLGY